MLHVVRYHSCVCHGPWVKWRICCRIIAESFSGKYSSLIHSRRVSSWLMSLVHTFSASGEFQVSTLSHLHLILSTLGSEYLYHWFKLTCARKKSGCRSRISTFNGIRNLFSSLESTITARLVTLFIFYAITYLLYIVGEQLGGGIWWVLIGPLVPWPQFPIIFLSCKFLCSSWRQTFVVDEGISIFMSNWASWRSISSLFRTFGISVWS
jgi:hypothetical protein